MTATATPTADTTTIARAIPTERTTTTPLWRTTALAGTTAALATAAVAAAALAADVPLEIDGEQIPVAGFAQLTLICTAIGLLLAKTFTRWATKPQRTFVATTVTLTALSIVPDLTVTATTATRVVLVATHIVAAALVIPALSRRLAHA